MTPTQLRAQVYRNDPCLANIIDNENGRWDPTVDFGGGHGNTAESYGLPQANPGTKLAYYAYTVGRQRAGDPTRKDWATNALVQINWARNYAIGKFGSTCAAWAYWRAHLAW